MNRNYDENIEGVLGIKPKSRFGNPNTTTGTYAKPQPIVDILLESQRQIKTDLLNKIESLERNLNTKIDAISELLSSPVQDTSLAKDYMNVLLFIQKLYSYLSDPSINPDFAVKVRKDITRILSMYGYEFLDFNPSSDISLYENSYDIEVVGDALSRDYELESRTIVDKKGETVVRGKVYIKRYDINL